MIAQSINEIQERTHYEAMIGTWYTGSGDTSPVGNSWASGQRGLPTEMVPRYPARSPSSLLWPNGKAVCSDFQRRRTERGKR
jgi:hypothetical protein